MKESDNNYSDQQKDKQEGVKKDIKIIKYGGVVKYRFLRVCLSLYDYQFEARVWNVLKHLKNRVITNQKHTTDSQNPKENESIIQKKTSNHKRKDKKKTETLRNTKQLENKV